jgi:phosphoserine phosphatase RsbU/P
MDATGPQMACMEVWGGSQLANHATAFGGLDVWVYSRPHGQSTRGGDVVYASSCATGRITRLMVADVAGHGHTVAATAADLRLLMRRFVNCLDQTELVRRLNQQFAALSSQAAFATAVVATYFAPTQRLTLCNAGHPRPLIYRAAAREWRFLGNHDAPAAGPRNLPLGILDIADYDASDIELEDGDCVLAYTDAVMESQDADGEMLGEDGVLRILQLLGEVEASRLIPTLVNEIAERYPNNLADDDLTVMVVRATSHQVRYSLADRVRALGRVLRTAAGALRPGAERPPLPDVNLANLGGPIVPALQQRWRARGR